MRGHERGAIAGVEELPLPIEEVQLAVEERRLAGPDERGGVVEPVALGQRQADRQGRALALGEGLQCDQAGAAFRPLRQGQGRFAIGQRIAAGRQLGQDEKRRRGLAEPGGDGRQVLLAAAEPGGELQQTDAVARVAVGGGADARAPRQGCLTQRQASTRLSFLPVIRMPTRKMRADTMKTRTTEAASSR